MVKPTKLKNWREFWKGSPKKDRWWAEGHRTYGVSIVNINGEYVVFVRIGNVGSELMLPFRNKKFKRLRDAQVAAEEYLDRLSAEQFSYLIGIPVIPNKNAVKRPFT